MLAAKKLLLVRRVALMVSGAAPLAGCSDGVRVADLPAQQTDAGPAERDADAPAGDAAVRDAGRFWRATLVPNTANEEAPIAVPHKVRLIDSQTGAALDPPFEAISDGNGQISVPVDPGREVSIYVEGIGPDSAATSTYDTVVLNMNFDSGDTLLRLPRAGAGALAGQSASFAPLPDRAAMTGSLFWSPGRQRRG